MKIFSACAIVAWGLGMGVSTAQEIPAIQSDRPDETESSSVMALGAFQVEAGVVYEDERREMSTHTNVHRAFAAPSVLARYGLLEWLELRAEGEYLLDRNEQLQGASSIGEQSNRLFSWGLGAKVQLLREEGITPEAALIAGIGVSDESDGVIPALRLSLSHTLASGVELGYNVGGELSTDAETFSEGFTGIYTVALGFDISESVGSFVEVFGSLYDGASPEHSCDAGLTYLLSPNLQLDAAGGLGISDTAPDYFLTAGVSVQLP